MIIFGSLLTTFEMSKIFRTVSLAEIDLDQTTILSKLAHICDGLGYYLMFSFESFLTNQTIVKAKKTFNC